jgi:hypothetical protein
VDGFSSDLSEDNVFEVEVRGGGEGDQKSAVIGIFLANAAE